MSRWPVSIDLPVQWGDMDAFQHVNNVAYLRWFESARIAHFDKAGLFGRMPALGPILARQTIDYRFPLVYPDTVRVEAATLKLGKTSFTLGLRLESVRHRKLAAEGEGVVVMLDYRTNEKVPLDADLRARLQGLEPGR